MQTKRFLVVIGAVAAVWASPLQSFAGPDTEAQAKLREALRQKMEALDTTAPAPAPAAKAAAPKVEAAKPAAVAPAAAAPTVVVPVPVEAVAATSVAATAAKGDSKFSEVPTSSEDATAAKLREAMRQKLAEPVAPAAATTAAVAAPAQPAASVTPVAPVAPVVAPAPAPAVTSVVASQPKAEPAIAPAFSGSKQDRLAGLLMQYKADLITPQQYHIQRAAIIAEP